MEEKRRKWMWWMEGNEENRRKRSQGKGCRKRNKVKGWKGMENRIKESMMEFVQKGKKQRMQGNEWRRREGI